MATFYSGYRSVLKGRSSAVTHPYKGTVGVYSNWSNFNTSHVLDGAPDANHVPGEGRHPHGLKLSRLYQGLENGQQPITGVGNGARLDGHRYRPLENKAAGNSLAFKSGFGHAVNTPELVGGQQYGITDWTYNGVTAKDLSGSFGHAVRAVNATGTANTFGSFGPNNYGAKSAVKTQLNNPGSTTTFLFADNTTAHKEVGRWYGVPSSKALK